MPNSRNLLIIGGGPAGLTAALYAARANLAPLVLAGSTPGGQLMLTSEVENYPGFSEPILGPDLMERWRQQAMRYGAAILNEDANAMDVRARPFRITAAGVTHEARAVIIATGAKAKWLGIPNEQRLVGRGVHTCVQCDGFAYRGKFITVVGGGDTAMEETLTLAKLAREVMVVHRRAELRASKVMADRALRTPNVHFVWNTTIEDVGGGDRVTNVRLRHVETQEVREVPTDGLFVAIGYTPATDFLGDQLARTPTGYLVVHEHTRTSVDGVFAAGDVEDARYRQAVTAAGAGCMAAIDAERWLATQF